MNKKFQILIIFLLMISPAFLSDHMFPFYDKLGTAKLDELINFFDINPEDGCLSTGEIYEFLMFEFKIAKQYFKRVDKNGDGKVDRAEMEKKMDIFINDKEIGKLLKGMNLKPYNNETFALNHNEHGHLLKVKYDNETFALNLEEHGHLLKIIREKLGEKIEADMKEKNYMENVDNISGALLFHNVVGIFLKENEDGSINEEQFDDLEEYCEQIQIFIEDADDNGNGDGKAARKELIKYMDLMKKRGQKLEL